MIKILKDAFKATWTGFSGGLGAGEKAGELETRSRERLDLSVTAHSENKVFTSVRLLSDSKGPRYLLGILSVGNHSFTVGQRGLVSYNSSSCGVPRRRRAGEDD